MRQIWKITGSMNICFGLSYKNIKSPIIYSTEIISVLYLSFIFNEYTIVIKKWDMREGEMFCGKENALRASS